MRGVETEWREPWWRHGGWETVSRGLEVILQIWRLGGHFCGDHGASAPPPSSGHFQNMVWLFWAFIITGDMYNFVQNDTFSWFYLINWNFNIILNFSGILRAKNSRPHFWNGRIVLTLKEISNFHLTKFVGAPASNSP